MTPDEKNTPPDDKDPDKKSPQTDDDYAKLRDELFADLDDEDLAPPVPEDTLESLRAERDTLLNKLDAAKEETLAARKDARRSLQRAEESFETEKKFAVVKLVKEMLPVVDNLERALEVIPAEARQNDPKFGKLAEGVEKTLAQLKAVFNKFGVREINPLGEAFDENRHDVITTQPKTGVDPETVIHVAQKGYEIEGRIIRPAKVIVTPQD